MPLPGKGDPSNGRHRSGYTVTRKTSSMVVT